MNAQEIAVKVTNRLQAHRDELRDYQFEVLNDLIREEDELWTVRIQSNRFLEKHGWLDDVLNDIEEEIKNDCRAEVMIVPVNPKEPTSATHGA